MASSWCKVSCDLDSHPKVRRAGNLGRQVFEFALRRNAALDHGGVIPSDHLEPWYLADQLMMSEQDAMSGLSRAVSAGLLARDGSAYAIAGWDDEWAKRPLTEAERKARQRAKSSPSDVMSGHVTNESGHDRDCPESHGSEERRGEETRREERTARTRRAPTGDHAKAIAHFDQRYASAYSQKLSWDGKSGALVSAIVRKHGLAEFMKRTDFLFDGKGPSWIKPPFTIGTLSSQWNSLVDAQKSDPLLNLATEGPR